MHQRTLNCHCVEPGRGQPAENARCRGGQVEMERLWIVLASKRHDLLGPDHVRTVLELFAYLVVLEVLHRPIIADAGQWSAQPVVVIARWSTDPAPNTPAGQFDGRDVSRSAIARAESIGAAARRSPNEATVVPACSTSPKWKRSPNRDCRWRRPAKSLR